MWRVVLQLDESQYVMDMTLDGKEQKSSEF